MKAKQMDQLLDKLSECYFTEDDGDGHSVDTFERETARKLIDTAFEQERKRVREAIELAIRTIERLAGQHSSADEFYQSGVTHFYESDIKQLRQVLEELK